MANTSDTQRQMLADATASILSSEGMRKDIEAFARSVAYRRFHPDQTLDKRVVLHEAVRAYLSTGNIGAAEGMIAEAYNSDNARLEISSIVHHSDFLSDMTARVFSVLRDHEIVDRQATGRMVFDHLVDAISDMDKSVPLDIADGKRVTVCYIPGSSQARNYWEIATTSWMPRSDSLSIYPDRTFLDFLEVVGLTKAEWLAGVERNVTMATAAKMGDLLEKRRVTWNAVEEWEANGSLEVDVDDVVAAVDACPYGFTPMIAFEMDAEDIFTMDFNEVLEVTGGIVGLHDFTNGSGDPLRFEGTLKLSPEAGDLHLADDQPLGLIATHGFLNTAFQSQVRRIPRHSPQMTATPPSP